MIRGRDQVRLTLQKLALRKKRAAFAVVSVALGVIVVVTVNSLLEGVRDVAIKTIWTEEIERDVVKVFSGENPYTFVLTEEERKAREKRRRLFLTESVFEQIRRWPEVEAADRPVPVRPVSIDAFANRPRPVTEVAGVPQPMLERCAQPALLAGCSNAVPLVVGERNVKLRYDEKRRKLELDDSFEPGAWLGREVRIVLGDNYAQLNRFRFDYHKREFLPFGEEELAAQREAMQSGWRSRYDMTVFNTTLTLRGRIVGFCPGNKVMVPAESAVWFEKWIEQREQLASLQPRAPQTIHYEERGRRTPRAGEYTEGIVLVKPGADVEAVARRIEELGFAAATRARVFEDQARAFDSSMRVVKRVALAFGGLVLGLAFGLVWSTTSKIVSDSRADIGLFRALGATRRDIRQLFLGEAVVQGLLGTAVGMVLGWLLATAISRWVVGFARRSVYDPEEALLIPESIFSLDVKFAVALLAAAAVVSLLAGLLPANRAANIDPVRALKRE